MVKRASAAVTTTAPGIRMMRNDLREGRCPLSHRFDRYSVGCPSYERAVVVARMVAETPSARKVQKAAVGNENADGSAMVSLLEMMLLTA